MSRILDRIGFKPAPIPAREAERAFVTGPAVVDPANEFWGIPSEEWQPEEYARYLATSNAVYACSMVRAKSISALPLRLYQRMRGGDKREVTNGPAFDLLHQINPYWTLNRWKIGRAHV